MIPATEKVIKPRPYRIYRQKTGSCFWSVNYTRSKIPFLCSGNKLQIFKYPPFEQTLCIDTYRINFVYQKMELQGNIAYLGKRKLQWYWSIFRFSSGKRRQNHDVAATVMPGRKTDVENTLWQRQFLVVVTTSETKRCDNVVTTLSDVVTKIQPKLKNIRCYNVVCQLVNINSFVVLSHLLIT